MKTQELRQAMVKSQRIQEKYEDALHELDRIQSASGGRQSDLVELLQRDVNNLRNENEQLKGTLKLS